MDHPFPGLLLHGATGGWDELAMLLIGIVLSLGVVALTERQRKRRGRSPDDASADGDQTTTPGQERRA